MDHTYLLNENNGSESDILPTFTTPARMRTQNQMGVSPSVSFTVGMHGLMLQQEEAFKNELEDFDNQIAAIEAENEAYEARIGDIESGQYDQNQIDKVEKDIASLTKDIYDIGYKNKEQLEAITEYERTMSRFRSQYESKKQTLIEQDKLLALETEMTDKYVSSMEVEFNNIHQKYEKCKHVLEDFKDCEKKLGKLAHESNEKIRIISYLFQILKEQSTEILEKCQNEITVMHKNNRTDSAKLQAIQQRMNFKYNSQETIIQRNKEEIDEIAKMCDRLIGKLPE